MHVDPHLDDNSRWRGRIAPFCAMLAVSVLQAHAAVSTCRPSDSDFACRLRSVLSLLQTAAVILGTLLVIAVLAAVRAYKRKPRKITPDDITPDAR